MRICEIFKSLQGEGLMMGVPTVFVRAVGCNLDCSWCDTKYSMTGGTEMSISEIIEKIGDCDSVCFTGGEPLLQNDAIELIETVIGNDKKLVLETNGSISLEKVPKDDHIIISMDVKCPSSGMTDKMLVSNLNFLSEKDQLKFIIKDQRDLDFAIDFVKRYDPKTNVIFGPVGGTDKLETLADAVLSNNLDVRVLPQLHKIIWGEKRGV